MPFIFGRAFRPEVDVCDELNGFRGGESLTSEGEVLRRLDSLSEGELFKNGSKSTGGGDDNGDELREIEMSAILLRLRSPEGGSMSSSGGGDERGEVNECAAEIRLDERVRLGVIKGNCLGLRIGGRAEAGSALVSSFCTTMVSSSTWTSISSLTSDPLSLDSAVLSRVILRLLHALPLSLKSCASSPLDGAGSSFRGSCRAAASNWAWISE